MKIRHISRIILPFSDCHFLSHKNMHKPRSFAKMWPSILSDQKWVTYRNTGVSKNRDCRVNHLATKSKILKKEKHTIRDKKIIENINISLLLLWKISFILKDNSKNQKDFDVVLFILDTYWTIKESKNTFFQKRIMS